MNRRIFILGAPGAGKSTLAQSLADIWGIPCHSTDLIAYVDANWTLRDLRERQHMVEEIAAQESWIVEGNHLDWTNLLVTHADHIIWLDPPLWLLLWRTTKRHIRWTFASRPPQFNYKALWEDYVYHGRFSWQTYSHGMDLENDRDVSRAATYAVLVPHRAKVYRYRRARSLNARMLSTQLLAE